MNELDLTQVNYKNEPFPHFMAPSVVTEAFAGDLLHWLETEAPWQISVQDFYEQYEFSFKDAELPASLAGFFAPPAISALHARLEELFGVTLRPEADITAHKLNRSQKIRIHNDARPGGETHRFLIQLNRGWQEANGGMLMLFSTPEVESLYDVITPVSRSGFGFAISQDSHHAVSQVHQGDRFTLVFSFYEKSN